MNVIRRVAFTLSLLFATALAAHAATSIVWTWNNAGINAPACSTTVKTTCLVGFTLTDNTGKVVAGPTVIVGLVSTYTQTTDIPQFASTPYTYTIVANYLDGSGNPIASASNAGPVTVTPGAPTGVTGTYSQQ